MIQECANCAAADVLTEVTLYDDDFNERPEWWCSGCVLDLSDQPAFSSGDTTP